MKALRITLILIGIVAALTVGLSAYGKRGVNSQFAKVDLNGYAEPMTIAVTVLHADGTPVGRASIKSESHSGTSNPVLTDVSGFAVIEPGEREVLAIHVDGRTVWHTPYQDGFLNLFFCSILCRRTLVHRKPQSPTWRCWSTKYPLFTEMTSAATSLCHVIRVRPDVTT